MTAFTPGYALPYPNDYNAPADSPSSLEDLAVATEAALNGKLAIPLPYGQVIRSAAGALMTAGVWQPVLSPYPSGADGVLRNGMGWWGTDAQFQPAKAGLHLLTGRIQADSAASASEFSVGLTSAGPTDAGVILDAPVMANQNTIVNFHWVSNLAAGARLGLRVLSTVDRRHSLVSWSLTYLGGY